ncbi:MAG: electron transfer flavoprotein subunit alpha/FixB family protein [Acidobacteriota bacterium]|nr:electron transfer flavoprotein subunit alpha/FixB family protein [Acidobacteriota bacterium]MDE3265210.1 electron transfer flavoprotein subunit alpha/FixB family protein [Acidobacteriota bacterium]
MEGAGGGPGTQEVRACGRALGGNCRVALLDEEHLGPYAPGLYAEALRALITDGDGEDPAAPLVVLLPHTYQSAEYAPRLAVRLDAAYIASVSAATIDDAGRVRFRRSILQARLRAEVRPRKRTVVATVQIGAFGGTDPAASPDAVVKVGRPADIEEHEEREVLGREAAGGGGVDLAGAERIVTAGRGVGGSDEVSVAAELAVALDAELGASRPVVDNGWLPREHQVGSSGHIVAPNLYLALGVSGSIQHLMGMSGSRIIVAINKDPEAPIFSVAHYGIVADLHEVAPVLTRLLEARRSS